MKGRGSITEAALVVGCVTTIIGGPLHSHPLAFQAAGFDVIHRPGQKANQTCVQQIRVCVFSCHRYCVGLLEPLMRSKVKSPPRGKMKALKCSCPFETTPTCHSWWSDPGYENVAEMITHNAALFLLSTTGSWGLAWMKRLKGFLY